MSLYTSSLAPMPKSTHPLTPQILLGAASSLVRSVECLVPIAKTVEVWGIALLSAHATEIILKAFLIANGVTEEQLEQKIRHHLGKAWRNASSLGLDIPSEPPRWCNLLDKVHDWPHFLRYPPTNTGMILPNLNDLSANLRGLHELVQRSISPNA